MSLCIPEHTIPWALITFSLVAALIVGWRGMDWITRHYERVNIRRRVEDLHVHNFRLGIYVNGVTFGKCACGATQPYKEPQR